jgi:hypothetical protein
MPALDPASDAEERLLRALAKQNRTRKQALLDTVVSRAAIDFVGTLRPVLRDGSFSAQRLLAEWIEVEAEALRRRARSREIFTWASRRTARTLNLLGESS